MKLNAEQLKELEAVARPLMVWLEKNCHPHVTAVVDSERTEVLEGIAVARKSSPQTLEE